MHSNALRPSPWPLDLVPSLLRWALGYSAPEITVKLIRPQVPSFHHPNGFQKIPLATKLDGTRLFLHVWNDQYRDPDVHDHRWHFASRLLYGRLVNHLYDITTGADKEEVDQFETISYARASASRDYQLSSMRISVVARVVARRTYVQSDSYTQSLQLFHRVLVEQESATLVSRGPRLHESARILAPFGTNITPPPPLKIIGPYELDLMIRRVLDRIE